MVCYGLMLHWYALMFCCYPSTLVNGGVTLHCYIICYTDLYECAFTVHLDSANKVGFLWFWFPTMVCHSPTRLPLVYINTFIWIQYSMAGHWHTVWFKIPLNVPRAVQHASSTFQLGMCSTILLPRASLFIKLGRTGSCNTLLYATHQGTGFVHIYHNFNRKKVKSCVHVKEDVQLSESA